MTIASFSPTPLSRIDVGWFGLNLNIILIFYSFSEQQHSQYPYPCRSAVQDPHPSLRPVDLGRSAEAGAADAGMKTEN
jgi:hypothetical protein